MEILKIEYDGDSIADMGRDIFEALDPIFNEKAKAIVSDKHGIPSGTFILTLEYMPA